MQSGYGKIQQALAELTEVISASEKTQQSLRFDKRIKKIFS